MSHVLSLIVSRVVGVESGTGEGEVGVKMIMVSLVVPWLFLMKLLESVSSRSTRGVIYYWRVTYTTRRNV